jgi:hypothetical protein
MDDDATRRLFPVHLFNSIATVMSLFGFWVWLFFSPYNSLRRGASLGSHMYEKNYFISSTISRSPFTVAASRLFLLSGQLFRPSVVGELPGCCDNVRGELCAIRNSIYGPSSPEPPCIVRPVRHRDEPPVSSLPRRKGARHDKTVRHFQTHVSCPHLWICPLKPTPNHVFLSCLCLQFFF